MVLVYIWNQEYVHNQAIRNHILWEVHAISW